MLNQIEIDDLIRRIRDLEAEIADYRFTIESFERILKSKKYQAEVFRDLLREVLIIA